MNEQSAKQSPRAKALAAVFGLVGCALSIFGFFHLDLFHTNPLVFAAAQHEIYRGE